MPRKTISKDIPLAGITLRRYERYTELTERELVRKICLSLGLLQAGDSRDIIVDIFYILLKARKNKEQLSSEEIEKRIIGFRKQEKLPLLGIAPSNIRRQLLRLRDLFIVEKTANNYRITEFLPLAEVFEEKIEGVLLPSIIMRIKEYLRKADEKF